MKIVFIIGPHAVGKMTVGQELEKISGLKLFHNHMVIELVTGFLGYGTPQGRDLVRKIRAEMFDAFAKSDEAGYILTFVWAFGEPGEREYLEGISKTFEEKGAEIFWVELEADLDVRLNRNRSANRLEHKPSKRDLDFSEHNLLDNQNKYRLNSVAGEISKPNYVRIDNTILSAETTAKQINSFLNTA